MSLLNIFRKLAKGTVTGKNHYPAIAEHMETIVGTKTGAFVAPLVPATPEGWSLVVKGTDKSGKHEMTKEIYVTPDVWGNTKIGDYWPPEPA
jgi:hypothetical protein